MLILWSYGKVATVATTAATLYEMRVYRPTVRRTQEYLTVLIVVPQ